MNAVSSVEDRRRVCVGGGVCSWDEVGPLRVARESTITHEASSSSSARGAPRSPLGAFDACHGAPSPPAKFRGDRDGGVLRHAHRAAEPVVTGRIDPVVSREGPARTYPLLPRNGHPGLESLLPRLCSEDDCRPYLDPGVRPGRDQVHA